MKEKEYQLIKNYMMECMKDSAHDKEHIYRVLYTAMDIASYEEGVDYDVLIAACLLHDIGRKEQYENQALCHAIVGADKAYHFLVQNNFQADYVQKVASCIKSHRFRSDNLPTKIEEKILFDSDKIDVTGTLGIARTILYKGQVEEPLYSVGEDGKVSDGSNDKIPSFFQEYKYKLEKLYKNFYTKRGNEIAMQRQQSAISFYENMLKETKESYQIGADILWDKLRTDDWDSELHSSHT